MENKSCKTCKHFTFIRYPYKSDWDIICGKIWRSLTDQTFAVPSWCPLKSKNVFRYEIKAPLTDDEVIMWEHIIESHKEKEKEKNMTELLSDSMSFITEADNLRNKIADFIKEQIKEIKDENGKQFNLDMINSSYNVAYDKGAKNQLVMEIHITTERK